MLTVSRVANLSKAPLDTEEAVRRLQANLAVGKKGLVMIFVIATYTFILQSSYTKTAPETKGRMKDLFVFFKPVL